MNTYLLICLLLLVGCTSIEDYKCKIGEKVGNQCITEDFNKTYYGCGSLNSFRAKDLTEFMYEVNPDDVIHTTKGKCMYEQSEIFKIDDFSINDSEIGVIVSNQFAYLINNNSVVRSICINMTYSYRWKRTIWNDTGSDMCMSELNEANAEIFESKFRWW